jgi:hypothetical protein
MHRSMHPMTMKFLAPGKEEAQHANAKPSAMSDIGPTAPDIETTESLSLTPSPTFTAGNRGYEVG